jgi:hypothetical protein
VDHPVRESERECSRRERQLLATHDVSRAWCWAIRRAAKCPNLERMITYPVVVKYAQWNARRRVLASTRDTEPPASERRVRTHVAPGFDGHSGVRNDSWQTATGSSLTNQSAAQ